MSSLITTQSWQICLIGSDQRKADQLRTTLNTTIYYFPDVSSFFNCCTTTANAETCLILVLPERLTRELTSDIKEKVRHIFIYCENNQNKSLLFNDVCLNLSGLIIAKWTAQSIYYRDLNENGLARICAQESITRSEHHIAHLQSLCNDIDENILSSQEATS